MSVDISCIAPSLLSWYGRSARVLPWRNGPEAPLPDLYRVWLSEIMLQQTTVTTVRAYFERFTARWPTVAALAAADEADVMAAWAGLGYYSRARNLLACARILAAQGFPEGEEGLLLLPGVGRYTAAAIAAIALGQRAVVVDGNVERVVARIFAVEIPLPVAKPQLRRLAEIITPNTRCGDFAQSMMDLGATVCIPRNPRCGQCPLTDCCAAYARGDPARYPQKVARVAKPERQATAWWIERESQVLLVKHPPNGLLGGMMGLPSTLVVPARGQSTVSEADDRRAFFVQLASGSACATHTGTSLGQITHVFTHFRLTLEVVAASLSSSCVLPLGAQWWPKATLQLAGLPTLFAKAAAVAMREST